MSTYRDPAKLHLSTETNLSNCQEESPQETLYWARPRVHLTRDLTFNSTQILRKVKGLQTDIRFLQVFSQPPSAQANSQPLIFVYRATFKRCLCQATCPVNFLHPQRASARSALVWYPWRESPPGGFLLASSGGPVLSLQKAANAHSHSTRDSYSPSYSVWYDLPIKQDLR